MSQEKWIEELGDDLLDKLRESSTQKVLQRERWEEKTSVFSQRGKWLI
jgi:hypothetical protein